MPEVLYEKPDISTSVFVLVPKSAEEKEFPYVVDVGKENGRKLPGGGVSLKRALEFSQVARELGIQIQPCDPDSEESIIAYAASAEVFEEIGLFVEPPTRKILEVHEPAHHWIAVASNPPISSRLLKSNQLEWLAADTPERREAIQAEMQAIEKDWSLKTGTGIVEAHWDVREALPQVVAERKFFTKHGWALKWYLSGRAQSVIDDILLDTGIISWFVDDDGCLVLCYDEACQVCEREEIVVQAAEPVRVEERKEATMELMERLYPEHFPRRSSILNFSLHEVRQEPILPDKQQLSGDIEVMLVTADRFEETLWLAADFHLASREHGRDFDLRREYKHAVSPHVVRLKEPTTALELAKTFGMACERQAALQKPGQRTVVLLVGTLLKKDAKGRPVGPTGFTAFSLNGAPPSDILIGFEQAKLIPEAVERFNRIHAPNILWMHDVWGHLARNVKYKKAGLQRENEREPRARSFA